MLNSVVIAVGFAVDGCKVSRALGDAVAGNTLEQEVLGITPETS
jgi:hypothetical protein